MENNPNMEDVKKLEFHHAPPRNVTLKRFQKAGLTQLDEFLVATEVNGKPKHGRCEEIANSITHRHWNAFLKRDFCGMVEQEVDESLVTSDRFT
jgi:hypothetical protein